MARTWAIHCIVGAELTDVTRPAVAARLAVTALSHVSAVLGGAVDVGIALERLLWPNGARPISADPWWSTPLGQLVMTASLERLHGLSNGRSDAVHQLAS